MLQRYNLNLTDCDVGTDYVILRCHEINTNLLSTNSRSKSVKFKLFSVQNHYLVFSFNLNILQLYLQNFNFVFFMLSQLVVFSFFLFGYF